MGKIHRSIDGTGNNIDNPTFGSTGVPLERMGAGFVDYEDGVQKPNEKLPNPR